MGSKCTHIFIILAAVQSKIYVLSDREYKLSKDMDQREAMKTVTYHESAANHHMLHFNLSNKKTYVDSFRKSWNYEDAGERKRKAENGSSNAILRFLAAYMVGGYHFSLHRVNPLPGFMGRFCEAPCQPACVEDRG